MIFLKNLAATLSLNDKCMYACSNVSMLVKEPKTIIANEFSYPEFVSMRRPDSLLHQIVDENHTTIT